MTNKKRAVRVILVACLILLFFVIGYTFAKYYQEIRGGGTGSIARWSFVASGRDGSDINRIALEDTANRVSLVDGKIAPGTEGSFDIVIDATGSEVGVDYAVRVADETNLPTNFLYKVVDENGNESQSYSSLEELANSELQGTLDTINGEYTKTLTVNWEWPFETEIENSIALGDAADLADGTKADLNYEFVLEIIGSQSRI